MKNMYTSFQAHDYNKRRFGKQIRYESRKSTADTKRRMKGRFTKAGADYDYDPRANYINELII